MGACGPAAQRAARRPHVHGAVRGADAARVFHSEDSTPAGSSTHRSSTGHEGVDICRWVVSCGLAPSPREWRVRSGLVCAKVALRRSVFTRTVACDDASGTAGSPSDRSTSRSRRSQSRWSRRLHGFDWARAEPRLIREPPAPCPLPQLRRGLRLPHGSRDRRVDDAAPELWLEVSEEFRFLLSRPGGRPIGAFESTSSRVAADR
jgi:hypothetical protein